MTSPLGDGYEFGGVDTNPAGYVIFFDSVEDDDGGTFRLLFEQMEVNNHSPALEIEPTETGAMLIREAVPEADHT